MPKIRCQKCEKKLLIEYTCKCEKRFCITHLQPQDHGCTFDYREQGKQTIQAIMNSEPRTSQFERI